uniref:Uncharacterized protein n=1 Tax=Glossina brevipalpis TaxID=37001 RepID=A0A1A9WS37_9MUSC
MLQKSDGGVMQPALASLCMFPLPGRCSKKLFVSTCCRLDVLGLLGMLGMLGMLGFLGMLAMIGLLNIQSLLVVIGTLGVLCVLGMLGTLGVLGMLGVLGTLDMLGMMVLHSSVCLAYWAWSWSLELCLSLSVYKGFSECKFTTSEYKALVMLSKDLDVYFVQLLLRFVCLLPVSSYLSRAEV